VFILNVQFQEQNSLKKLTTQLKWVFFCRNQIWISCCFWQILCIYAFRTSIIIIMFKCAACIQWSIWYRLGYRCQLSKWDILHWLQLLHITVSLYLLKQILLHSCIYMHCCWHLFCSIHIIVISEKLNSWNWNWTLLPLITNKMQN